MLKLYLFQTTFWHQGSYSATTIRTSTLFLSYKGNKVGANFFLTLYRTNYTCSYSILHPHNFMNTDDLILFEKKMSHFFKSKVELFV